MASRAEGRAAGSHRAAAADPHHARRTLRRHALGGASARGLLLTVMGEFVLPTGGTAWTSAFLAVMERLGVEPGTTRQALARTATAGWLESERFGRHTCWQLSQDGVQLLSEGTKRIYEFAGPSAGWDGRWLVVLVSVPESDRAGRHVLRSRLTWAGLGSPAPGVWIGTQVSRLPEVEEVLSEAGILERAHVFVAEHLGSTPITSMVADAWDLESIESEYEAFLEEFSSARAADPLARTIELVHAWRRFPWRDPALPRALLPRRWKGADAAELFQRRHAEWTDQARAEWDELSVLPR